MYSGNIEDNINLFLEAAEEGFKEAMRMAEAETGQRIGCVMADAFLWFAGSMAEEMGVLWVPLWTSGAGSLSVHCYTDLIRETVGIHGKKFGAKDKFTYINYMHFNFLFLSSHIANRNHRAQKQPQKRA